MKVKESAHDGLLSAVRDHLRRNRKSKSKKDVSYPGGGWGYDDMTPEEQALYDEERAAIAAEKAEHDAELAREREARRKSASDSLLGPSLNPKEKEGE